jgi:hypothetical protein
MEKTSKPCQTRPLSRSSTLLPSYTVLEIPKSCGSLVRLVVKGGYSVLPCEAQGMVFARTHTHIPVPAVHRVIPGAPDDGYYGPKCYIVMDYIEGESLDAC